MGTVGERKNGNMMVSTMNNEKRVRKLGNNGE